MNYQATRSATKYPSIQRYLIRRCYVNITSRWLERKRCNSFVQYRLLACSRHRLNTHTPRGDPGSCGTDIGTFDDHTWRTPCAISFSRASITIRKSHTATHTHKSYTKKEHLQAKKNFASEFRPMVEKITKQPKSNTLKVFMLCDQSSHSRNVMSINLIRLQTRHSFRRLRLSYTRGSTRRL